MEDVKLLLEEDGSGMFYIMDDGESLAEMRVSVQNGVVTAHHTEVLPRAEGNGLGKQLFKALVEYARGHQFKLKAYCPFVLAQLKKNSEEYRDLWIH